MAKAVRALGNARAARAALSPRGTDGRDTAHERTSDEYAVFETSQNAASERASEADMTREWTEDGYAATGMIRDTALTGGRGTVRRRASGARATLSPEAQENRMISMAMDLAEQKLRDGTASSQLITELVKRGSAKARLEVELLEKQTELAAAKTEALRSQAHMEELMEKAMAAMKRYNGQFDEEVEDDGDGYY